MMMQTDSEQPLLVAEGLAKYYGRQLEIGRAHV